MCLSNDQIKNIVVGSKLILGDEKQKYTVQARSERYIICTKPFNLKKTVIYTIIDIEKGIRGTDNLVFGVGYETKDDCEENLKRLEFGEMEVSLRNFKGMDIRLAFHPHISHYS